MFSFQRANTAQLQDKLTGMLIGLARATEGNDHMLSESTAAAAVEGLAATATDGNVDPPALLAMMDRVEGEKRKLVPECYRCACPCGRTNDYDMHGLQNADEDVRDLKESILLGIRGIAACAHDAAALGHKDEAVHQFLYRALFAIGRDDWGREELQPMVQEQGEVKRRCAAMLNEAKAEA